MFHRLLLDARKREQVRSTIQVLTWSQWQHCNDTYNGNSQ